jgi:hypothetical protein
MANSEWRIGMCIERCSDQFLPGPAGMAGFYDIGRVVLPAHPQPSEGRDVWVDVPNPAGCRLRSGEYRGGARTGKYAKLHSIPPRRPRIAEGVGDAFAACREGRLGRQSGCRPACVTVRSGRKNAPLAHSLAATKRWRIAMGDWQSANSEEPGMNTASRSLFAIRYSLFAFDSPFPIRTSPARPSHCHG